MALHRFRSFVAGLLVCVSVFLFPKPLEAQGFNIGPSKGDVVAVIVGIVAVGVVIGVGVVLLVRHHPSLTGCVASGPDGMTLENELDHAAFTLTGATAGLKAGERVHVIGHKEKGAPGGKAFWVQEVRRDYGPCTLPQRAGTP